MCLFGFVFYYFLLKLILSFLLMFFCLDSELIDFDFFFVNDDVEGCVLWFLLFLIVFSMRYIFRILISYFFFDFNLCFVLN